MALSTEDIEAIASMTAQKLCATDQAFYVPKEDHYQDHLLIKQMRENSEAWSDVLTFVKGERRIRERRQNDARSLKNQLIGALMVAGALGSIGLLGAWGLRALGDFIKVQGGG